jgi:hypothetical protein
LREGMTWQDIRRARQREQTAIDDAIAADSPE